MPWRAHKTMKLSRGRTLKRSERPEGLSPLSKRVCSLTHVTADFEQGGGLGEGCWKTPCPREGRAVQEEGLLLSHPSLLPPKYVAGQHFLSPVRSLMSLEEERFCISTRDRKPKHCPGQRKTRGLGCHHTPNCRKWGRKGPSKTDFGEGREQNDANSSDPHTDHFPSGNLDPFLSNCNYQLWKIRKKKKKKENEGKKRIVTEVDRLGPSVSGRHVCMTSSVSSV